MLLHRVRAEADAAAEIDWDISVDSTSVRAHHHTADARYAPPPAVKRGLAWAAKLLGSGRN